MSRDEVEVCIQVAPECQEQSNSTNVKTKVTAPSNLLFSEFLSAIEYCNVLCACRAGKAHQLRELIQANMLVRDHLVPGVLPLVRTTLETQCLYSSRVTYPRKPAYL